MTEKDLEIEALSALMDGEANQLELRRTLNLLETSQESRAFWQRQHMISQVLNSGKVERADIDVSERVSQTLRHGSSTLLKPLTNMAVAASVTIALVLLGQQVLTTSGVPDSKNLISDVGGEVVQIYGAQPIRASFGTKVEDSASKRQIPVVDVDTVYEQLARDRYRYFGLRHAQISARSNPAPFISFVRMVEERAQGDIAE